MLKQLDTLIGFAVVMSVVSLLIMVATQAITSMLALRGKNLRPRCLGGALHAAGAGPGLKGEGFGSLQGIEIATYPGAVSSFHQWRFPMGA
jgi:hypothetical protein